MVGAIYTPEASMITPTAGEFGKKLPLGRESKIGECHV